MRGFVNDMEIYRGKDDSSKKITRVVTRHSFLSLRFTLRAPKYCRRGRCKSNRTPGLGITKKT